MTNQNLQAPFEGGCQCGSLRYRCTAAPFVAYTCHCLECQKMTSSAFATCMQVPAEGFSITSGEPRQQERISDDGNTLTTSFCGECGTALFIENNARPRIRTLLVGTLDHAEAVNVSAHIWTVRKLPWVVLPPDHRVFERAGDWSRDYVDDPTRLSK